MIGNLRLDDNKNITDYSYRDTDEQEIIVNKFNEIIDFLNKLEKT